MRFFYKRFLLSIFFMAGIWAQAAEPLKIRLKSDLNTLDWGVAHTSYETYIIMNLMEGLVELGSDLTPQPALAEKWEMFAEGRIHRFTLKKNIFWSDGKPITSNDFIAAWLRVLDPKLKSPYAHFLYDIENAQAYHKGKIKDQRQVGMRVIDDRNLEVKLKSASPTFMYMPSFWVMFPIRADLIKKYGKNWTDPKNLAVTGSYVLSRYQKGHSITLKKNPKYHGTNQGPEQVDALIIASDSVAREKMKKGEIDFLLNVTTEDLLVVDKTLRLERYPYLATYYLGFRVDKGVLQQRDVRLALAAGIDRAQIPAELQGGQTLAHGFIPPGIQGSALEDIFKGTLYGSRGILTRLGYAEGKGFPKLKLFVEKFDGSDKLERNIVQSLKQNLGVTVEPIQGGKYPLTIKNGQADLFVAHWGADYPDASNFFSVFTTQSGTNYTTWKNTRYDELIKQAQFELDQQKRETLYLQAEELLINDQVVILPLFHQKNPVLLGKRVQKFELTPLNYLFFKKIKITQASQGD